MATRYIKARSASTQYGTLQYVTLDNIRIGIQVRYSNNEACWYMWLRNPAGTVIAGPIKIVAGVPDLWEQYHYNEYVPPGALYVEETPTLDTIDISSFLLYTEV